MAALYPHKQHGWQVLYTLYFPDGTQKKKYKHFRLKQKALTALQEIEKLELFSSRQTLSVEEAIYFLHRKFISRAEADALVNQKIPLLPPQQITWEMLGQVYKNHIVTVGSEMTRSTHPYRTARIMEYFRAIHPVDVTDTVIHEFITACRNKGYAKDTINKYLTALRIMLDFLVDEGFKDENPARKIPYLKASPQNIPRILYPDEFKKFLAGIRASSHLCRGYFAEMVMMYLYTGLRRYELLYMKTENINFSHKTVKVLGKGSKDRLIEVHDTLIPVLKSVIRKNGRRKGPLFFGGMKEPVVRYNEVSKAFKKFREDINLPEGVKLHSLRHTFISYLLAAGADIEYTRQIAGHESLRTTQKYTHLIPRREPQIGRLNYDKFIDKKDSGKVK